MDSSFLQRHSLLLVALIILLSGIIGVGVRYQRSVIEQIKRQKLQQQTNVPKASLDRTEHDWGTIPEKPAAETLFTISNTGTAPLEIKNILTSCGCTTAELADEAKKYQTMIDPGASKQVKVVFDPLAHQSKGDTTRAVRIESNDPENPFLIINLKAHVL